MLLWSMIVLEVMHDAPLLGDGGCTSFSASYSDCPLASVRVHARTDRTHTCTRCKSDVRTRGSLKCGSLRSMCGVCDVLEPSRSTVVECGGLVWRLEFVSALTRLQVCRFTALCIRFSREPWYVTCTRSAMYMSLLCFSLCTPHCDTPGCSHAPRFATAASLRIQERRGRELTSRAISASHGASSARGHSPEHGAR